jgi:hypothetical protein
MQGESWTHVDDDVGKQGNPSVPIMALVKKLLPFLAFSRKPLNREFGFLTSTSGWQL